MYISKISPINFKSRIIDAHAHAGNHNGGIYTKGSLDVYVKSPLPNGDVIEKMIVSDLDVLHGAKDEYQGNQDIVKDFKNDSRYSLLASCNPATGDIKKIEKLYNEEPNSFVGLKFHPEFQNLPPTDSKYNAYYRFAEEHNLPCLFHTAVNVDSFGYLTNQINVSDPELVYAAAKKFPKVPFVLAHLGAGWREAHDKTIDIIADSVKSKSANLYADISWVDIDGYDINGHSSKEHIVNAIKKLKGYGDACRYFGDQSYRLMFGTDVPLSRFHDWNNPEALHNYSKFINDIKYAIRQDVLLKADAKEIMENLFYNNAKKLYLSAKKGLRL